MNLKTLSFYGRKLVETTNETDSDENYELIDADEDGDTITLTFSRLAGSDDPLEIDDEE